MKLIPQFIAVSTLLIGGLNAATVINVDTIKTDWGTGSGWGTTKTYTTNIDAISTVVTFSATGGSIYLNASTQMGVNGSSDNLNGVESFFNEFLTISLAPAVAAAPGFGIQYTITAGSFQIVSSGSPTVGFTNVANTVTYASATSPNGNYSPTFTTTPSGIDALSFVFRQIASSGVNNTEGGYLRDFTVTASTVAIPEPSAFALFAVASFGLLLRRRR